MRVTNTMMRNNSMLNMQKNKVAYNKYLTQYNTHKKIQRPSDDPTIAARALKYRTTLAEIDQYLTNIKDATSWMNTTETCLNAVNKKLTDMIDYCTQAATGTYNEKNRADIVTQLKQFSKYMKYLQKKSLNSFSSTCIINLCEWEGFYWTVIKLHNFFVFKEREGNRV